MIKLGGTASPSHMAVFQGIEAHFRRRGIDLDWVLYSSYDSLVEAFVSREIDLAWNGPLSYVKIKRRLDAPCNVIAMRDVDVDFITQFITRADSDVATVEDLKGKRFAFGSRGSVQAGLLAYHFLKQLGVHPRSDLAAYTFHDERHPSAASDETDVIEQVLTGAYHAGAVSELILDGLKGDEKSPHDSLRVLWSSPGYSHCCFTAQSDMDPDLSQQIVDAFLSVENNDPVGKAVLEGEGCSAFIPGVDEGWDILEEAAEQEGLI